jgi:hypothetical protein
MLWAYFLEPFKESVEFLELAPGSRVIGIPELLEFRELLLELAYEG